jgi:hypothetical protein
MKTLGLIFLLAGAGMAQDDTIEWLGSYRQAIEQAKAQHKPIFVEFRCEA